MLWCGLWYFVCFSYFVAFVEWKWKRSSWEPYVEGMRLLFLSLLTSSGTFSEACQKHSGKRRRSLSEAGAEAAQTKEVHKKRKVKTFQSQIKEEVWGNFRLKVLCVGRTVPCAALWLDMTHQPWDLTLFPVLLVTLNLEQNSGLLTVCGRAATTDHRSTNCVWCSVWIKLFQLYL